MRNALKKLFIFLFCTILIFNTCIATVSASELPDDEREDLNEESEELFKKLGRTSINIWNYLLAQSGCFINCASFEDYAKNDDAFAKAIDSIWTKENIQIKTDSNGKKSVVFSKVVADTLLKGLKDANKEPDNGGYELVKTVPVNKVSSLYFHNSVDYRSMYDLLKDNGGIMGLYYSGRNAYFYKIEPNTYYVLSSYITYNDKKYPRVYALKNVNSGGIKYDAYYLTKTDKAVNSWDLTEYFSNATVNSLKKNYFALYDYYSVVSNNNPLTSESFIVSSTGVSIPVFNTLDDLVAYTVANNLYYTTSDFTGEGKEIIIDFDELDKILNGYYDGMYDMLQKLIEQNGGNALTPEQVQALADQVAASFDMLKTEINNGFEEQDKLIQANSNLLVSIRSILGDGIEELKKLHSDTNGILESMLESMNLHFSGITDKLDEIFYNDTGGSIFSILNENIVSIKDSLENIIDEIKNLGNNTGEPPDGVVENVYQFFSDIINKLDEIFYNNAGKNILDEINENILIFLEQFCFFSADIKEILGNMKLSPSFSPSIKDDNGNVWDFLDFLTGLGDMAFDEAQDEISDLVGSLLEVFSGCLDLIKTRFPFSIPWDIVAIMAVLSAEPEAPVFNIPVVLDRYGIDTAIVIDFSQFDIVSKISRAFLTLIWGMYLMNYTIKFTDVKSK